MLLTSRSLRRRATRTAGLAVLATALVAGPAAALSTPTTPPPADGSTPTASPTVAGPQPSVPVADPSDPSAEELEAQREAAEALTAETAAQQQAVADARSRLETLSTQAGEALERYQQALGQKDAAEAEQAIQRERLAAATEVLQGNRADLGRWASQAYREGGAMAHYEGWMTVLESRNTDDLSQRLTMLSVVGRVRGNAVEVARQARTVQRDAASRSRAAAQEATDAAGRAEQAKAEADELLDTQRTQLAALEEMLTQLTQDAASASSLAEQLAIARASAEQRRLASPEGQARRGGGNAVTGAVGDCAGGSVETYPNGSIPLSALCPVGGGHHLRADAAYAFGQLAAAYTAQFGQGLCITDSYRTVQSQVSLYASKPNLAAVPGTSNHGWGTAVDLCGGIERFGTVQHTWMRANAPLFGWFHPSWAQAGGSRPEPWHWEFGG